MSKIAVLVGSLRKESINGKFAKAIEGLLPEGVTFDYADISGLPLFSQDLEANVPVEVTNLKSLIEAADGVFIVTPEYNRGYPGVLKNAIDWASRPYGSNSFAGKPVVLAGVSGHLGASQAQQQLRSTLVYLDTNIMGQPEAYIDAGQFFDEDGSISEGSRQFAENYTRSLVAHISGKSL